MVELALFVILAITSVAGAVTVIWARNPVHAAMGLLGTMFSLAVMYVVNLAHLVAAVQVIVYAGAVMTLFLFVIMLVGVDKAESRSEPLPLQRQLAIGLGVITLGLGVALAFGSGFQWVPAADPAAVAPNGTIETVAGPMFTDWVLAFEATALLLTIAAAGAIALAYFKRGSTEETVE